MRLNATQAHEAKMNCIRSMRMCRHVEITLSKLKPEEVNGALRHFILHHIDNVSSHNNPSNHMLLCRSCNTGLHPRGVSKRGIAVRHRLLSLYRIDNDREIENDNVLMNNNEERIERIYRMTAELARNIHCEPKFLNWVCVVINKYGSVNVVDLINGGAKEAGCSQQTARRYLDKECNPINGAYEYYTDDNGVRLIRKRIEQVMNQ